jgi:hypothetical protein
MFTLEQVVPWGRSFDEYRRMFALTEADLRLSILGCGDGPASFNAEATRRGVSVISCDPIYRWDGPLLRERIDATYQQIIDQTRQNAHEFVWDSIRSVEELGAVRMTAMQSFLDDYGSRRTSGRYVAAELPTLPFADDSFDLALCSHFLFLYSSHLSEAFHRSDILEMCRVAREVRVFPLLALGGERSPYVDAVADDLRSSGHDVSIQEVPYEFQKGGKEMMRVVTRRAFEAVPIARRRSRTP